MVYEIKEISLDDLNPAEYNPRTISEKEFEKLSNSIRVYGLVDPIIVTMDTFTIIGGHQRYSVLRDENKKNGSYNQLLLFPRGDVGWVFTKDILTIKGESYEKGLNLALNRISGEWDYPRLNFLLDELSDNLFDVSLTGFDNLDLADLDVDLDDLDIGLDEDIITENISQIVVILDSEDEQFELYNRLVNDGYDVKIRGK